MTSEASSSLLEYVYDASVLSNAIYSVKDCPTVEGFNLLHHHDGTVADFRVAHWCIFVSEKATNIYIVFRGSFATMDCFSNLSFIPFPHPYYPDVSVHSGYYTEVEREYEAVKAQLSDVLNTYRHMGIPIQKVVVTGHSKGGALAQLLTDKIFNDESYNAVHPFLRNTLVCITFASSLCYWFKAVELVESVKSSVLCHNFIVKGDIVPVLQIVLSEYPDSVYRFIDMEARKKSYFGTAALNQLGINSQLKDLALYTAGFKPVGSVYSASVSKLDDLYGVTFRLAVLDLRNLGNWDCVKDVQFGVEYHTMRLHIAAAKQDYEAFCSSHLVTVLPPKVRGLYVQNTTDEDLLFVMSQLTPLHWARIPCKKTMYVPSGCVWFRIRVSKYDQKDEPTRTGVAAKIGGLAALSTVGVVMPFITSAVAATTVAVATTYSSKKETVNPGKDCMDGVYADGRVVVVKKYVKDGVETDYFELSVTKKGVVESEMVPASEEIS